ncbi:hypothetical protein ACDQ58_00005 [Fusobacterium animalis]
MNKFAIYGIKIPKKNEMGKTIVHDKFSIWYPTILIKTCGNHDNKYIV